MINQRVQAVAVALFVLIIAGVIAVLLSRADREAAPKDRPPPSTSDDLDSADEGPVGRVSIKAGTGDLILRVHGGSCSTAGGPKLELSDNRGRTFHEILVPQVDEGNGISASSPKVRAIVYAVATSPASMTVGAADEKCTIHPYTTTDGGVTWTQKPGPLKQWYIDPKSGAVVSPSGPTDAGCTGEGIASLAPVTKSTARVLCADGTVHATSTKGGAWASVGKLPGVSAAVFTGTQTGYALAEKAGCKSRLYFTNSGGANWAPRGCVIKEFVIPGLSGIDRRLVAGGTAGVRLSTDRGATWKSSTKK